MTDGPSLTVAATAAGPELLLRPWRSTDLAALAAVGDDEALRRWTSVRLADPAATADWLARQLAGWTTGTSASFAVMAAAGGLLGHIVLKDPRPGGDGAEVGYWTLPAARGRGVASRALARLTDWAFERYGLAFVDLLHQADNLASCRVAERTGYPLLRTLEPLPPALPAEGHLHRRHHAGLQVGYAGK